MNIFPALLVAFMWLVSSLILADLPYVAGFNTAQIEVIDTFIYASGFVVLMYLILAIMQYFYRGSNEDTEPTSSWVFNKLKWQITAGSGIVIQRDDASQEITISAIDNKEKKDE